MTSRARTSTLLPLWAAMALAGCLPPAENTPTTPALTGPRIGNELTLALRPPDEEEDPVAAWGDGHYMVVWQSTRDGPTRVYATPVTGAGEVIRQNGAPLSDSPGDQLFPVVARGDGNFLVVWQDLRSRKQWEIYGARVDATGRPLDAANLPLSTGDGSRKYPTAAWGGRAFLVVWMQERPGSGWDVMGARVTADGVVLDPRGIAIGAAEKDQSRPVVAWTGTHYLVAWIDTRRNDSDIYGARLDAEGAVLDQSGIPIAAATGEQAHPSVAWNGAAALVVWADRRDGANYLLYGARVNGKGTVLEPNGIPLSTTPRLHMFPDVACRPTDCLVVWEEEWPVEAPRKSVQDIVRDVAAAVVTSNGEQSPPAVSGPMLIAPRALGNHFSKVSTDGRRYFVVWKDYRAGPAAGFGRLIDLP